MSFLKLTFINLTKFMKEHTIMFIIFILVEIISITAILCSYGLIANSTQDNSKRTTMIMDYIYLDFIKFYDNDDVIVEINNHLKTNILKIKENKEITVKKFKEEILPLLENSKYLINNINEIYLECIPQNLQYAENMDSLYNFSSVYYPKYVLNKYLDEDFYSRNGFYKSDYQNGEKIVIFPYYYEYPEPNIKFGNTVYSVKSNQNIQYLKVPYTALDDNVFLCCFRLYTINPLQYYELEELQSQLCGFLDIDKSWSTIPSEPEPVVIQINNTIILCCILIILVILINVSLFYEYIIVMRRQNLSISRLCGCTVAKAYIIYMVEIMTVIIICYLLSLILFNFVAVPLLTKSFAFFETPYPVKLHLTLFITYIVVAFLLMTSHVYKILKQPMDFLKKGDT